jgi:hypothetical protein
MRSSLHRDARARAFQTAAMLLVLMAVLGLLLHSLVFRSPVEQSRSHSISGQPATGRS